MEFYFKDGAKTRFLEEIASAFRDHFPSVYNDFMRHVREETKRLINPTGMSAEGHFMIKMYLPSKLYTFVKWQARKRLGIDEFFNDRKNYDLLCKVWSGCQPERKRTPFFDQGARKQHGSRIKVYSASAKA